MELLILDENFKSIYLIDVFESFIWTERYIGAGSFELYTPVNDRLLEISKVITDKRRKDIDSYIWLNESNQMMIIETTELTTEIETGTHITFSGRSLESMLDRRIVWKQTILDSYIQTAFKKLLNENVISPSIPERKIPNFIFVDSSNPEIAKMKISAQYTGDNLYDTLVEICNAYNIGFRITLNNANKFEFTLFSGIDRTYDQTENPYVIFSPKFDNLLNSNFLDSNNTMKNIALIAGEGEGADRVTRVVGLNKSGLARRELYVDARDIQSDTVDGKISDADYNAQLDNRGVEKLAANKYIQSFEGGIEAHQTFVYGKDFFIGDIVQISTEYGIDATVRVVELVRSQDTTGYNVYPTFSIIE